MRGKVGLERGSATLKDFRAQSPVARQRQPHPCIMVADPRINDREIAAINAAAVTREYHVQPHLGASDNQD